MARKTSRFVHTFDSGERLNGLKRRGFSDEGNVVQRCEQLEGGTHVVGAFGSTHHVRLVVDRIVGPLEAEQLAVEEEMIRIQVRPAQHRHLV